MKKMIGILMFATIFIQAQDFAYVGTKKCKSCHNKKDKGAQYKVWTEQSHAKAFETLQTEKAIAIAKEKGLANLPHEAPECLKCHTTGFNEGGFEIKEAAFWDQKTDSGKPTKAVKRMEGLKNVGCEACHGPGDGYRAKKKMKAIFDGTADGAEYGLLTPDSKTCEKCHNDESPTSKPFDYEERVAKIAHPYPEGFRVK